MKMNLDDPNLTAYALDELSPEQESAMEKIVAQSAEAQDYVRETRLLAGRLRTELHDDLERASVKPFNILPLPVPRSFWSDARWMSIGLAALLAVGAVIAAVVLSGQRFKPLASAQKPQNRSSSLPSGDVQMEVLTESSDEPAAVRDFARSDRTNPGSDDRLDENPFLLAATNPRSTFSLEVDTASYARVRRFIEQGALPPREAVKIEGMINYFAYDYRQPATDQSVSINLEVAGCPWRRDHRLVRIGLRGREALAAIAKELRVQVEFNPARVTSYRLIGYEKGRLRKEDSEKIDAGEMGAAQAVTALYEVVPVPLAATSSEMPEMLTVKLQRQNPGDTSELAERALSDAGTAFEAASADLKFAAAVAEFGMILRKSPHKGDGSLGTVLEWANAGRGNDSAGERQDFISLVQTAERLLL